MTTPTAHFEFIVTVRNSTDLSQIYDEIESDSGSDTIPDRAIPVFLRRPLSNNTHYKLTFDEAAMIKTDPRVAAVELATMIAQSVTPSWTTPIEDFNKSSITSPTDYNWALKRCTDGIQTPNWGRDVTVFNTDSVSVGLSGKNVDVIIVDGHFDPNHPTFSTNADGTGGSRVNQFDWHSLNSIVASIDDDQETLLSSPYVYTPYTTGVGSQTAGDNNHGCHVAGTVAGNENGWARDANIYNISPYGTNPNNISSLTMWDYIRAFHRSKPVNPETGIKNPTICNCSYGNTLTFPYVYDPGVLELGPPRQAHYRGTIIGDNISALTSEQLTSAGIYNTDGTARIPYLFESTAADIQQALDDGIIIVGAAGNDYFKMDVPGGLDYDNFFIALFIFPSPIFGTIESPFETWNYHRGQAPSCVSNVICVGSVNANAIETKSSFSNCGPRVSIFAPGTYIMSSFNNTDSYTSVPDLRNSSFVNGKISGTSMAAPQVCGVLACILEEYPNMTQDDALAYIQHHSTIDQLTATTGGTADYYDLQGAPNRYLYVYPERPPINSVYPKVNFKLRPTAGAVYPRSKNRVYK